MIKRIKQLVKERILLKMFHVMANNNYIENYPKLRRTYFSANALTWINNNIEIIDFNQNENLIYLKKDNLIFVTTPDYPWIVREIFCWNIYFINPLLLKASDYTVFDMGVNRGYASLYFANQFWCKEVYGFELNENTFKIAQKNLDLNGALKTKVKLFNFGLGDKDEKINSYYLPNRDGICTTSLDFLKSYAPEELTNAIETESVIKRSSSAIKEIVEENNLKKIIIKIDVEGAEYSIIKDLALNYPEFFDKVDILIGESHLGLAPLEDDLKVFGFKNVSSKGFQGKTQDFLFIKE